VKIIARSGHTLRFPQPKSINKVRRLLQHEHGAILADSMGLGKTATAVNVAVLLQMKRILVICPKSAIPDWRREIVDWDKHHGMIQHRTSLMFNRGWTLINYEMLKRHAGPLRKREWDLIIIDESHATKEPNCNRTRLIYGGDVNGTEWGPIPHRKAIIISGTPFKNRIEELFEPLHFIKPDKWPDREAFIDTYYPPEFDQEGRRQRNITKDGRVVGVAPVNLDDLHRQLQDDMVRTHKDDVPGLPQKRFELIPISVSLLAAFYFAVSRAKLRKLYAQLISIQLREQWNDAADAINNKITALHSEIALQAIDLKLQPIIDYLLTFTEKTVVIGFHRQDLLDLVAQRLRVEGLGVVEHNGDTSHNLKWSKNQFRKNAAVQFFVGQLTVSNLSLTLTTAKHIVFLELPQTWSDFEQATDRIHRYGQTAPEVTITAFVLPEAGDDDMLDNLQKWKDQSDLVLDGRELPPIPWHILGESQGKHVCIIDDKLRAEG
jgi:SNF2 family DNA or RNA helicase